MTEPVEPDSCERCKLPIFGNRYTLRVDAEGPASKSVELTLCESCLESLHRWLMRRKGSQTALDEQLDDSGFAPMSGRKLKARRGTQYVGELERGEWWIRARMAMVAASIVIAFAGLLAWTIWFLGPQR
jgi:hypothetical protein